MANENPRAPISLPVYGPVLNVTAPTPTANVFPWQPYLSRWTGTGDDPAADRAKRFRLMRGKFASRTPANMMQEFLAFGDVADTEIEEADAVVTQVYIQVGTTESILGSGLVTFGQPTIKIAEGDDLFGAIGPVPNFGADGSLPTYLVVPICEALWWGGQLHFSPGAKNYLNCGLVVSGTDCDHAGRMFVVSAA